MSEAVIVALVSLAGTLLGSFGGILTANRLVNYRLEQLEEKVSRHNSVMERTFRLEGRMNEAEHDITELKQERKGRVQ